MTLAWEFAAESSVAADVVYVEGPFMAVLVFSFIFLFVALTDNMWFIGAGLFVVLTSGFFAFWVWHSMADHPLAYRDGDRPRSETEGTGLYEVWELGSRASVSTTFDADDTSDVESLAGDLTLGYGCPDARVGWHVYVDDLPLASGTFREGQERELTDVAVRSGHPPSVVRLTAARLDSVDCETELYWHSPGFEGPGHGKFRFVIPLPGD